MMDGVEVNTTVLHEYSAAYTDIMYNVLFTSCIISP